MNGNYWTECATSWCGKLFQLRGDDLSALPADYPIERRIGIADRIAALPFTVPAPKVKKPTKIIVGSVALARLTTKPRGKRT